MRKILALLLLLTMPLLPSAALAAGPCSILRTWNTNDQLTAPDLTNSFTQVGVTNMIATCVDNLSQSVSTMQTTRDPYPAQVESLASTLAGEIQSLRFMFTKSLGFSQWYKYTDPMVLGSAAPTGTNVAGSATTIQGGAGTGSGVGGNLLGKVAYPGSSGSNANTQSTVVTVLGTNNQASGTGSMVQVTPTINQSGTAGYDALLINATETATGSGAKNILHGQVGGVDKFIIDNTGAVTAGTWKSTALTPQYGGGQNQGRLQFNSTTQIKFCPYNGSAIVINGATQQIPAGCVLAANTSIFIDGSSGQNLAASTTYLVYVFMNSGTMTIDYSTTGHATSATAGNVGTEIKTGLDTRSLVGMVRTNGSSQFELDATLAGVISWFNRRTIIFETGLFSSTTTSLTPVEVNSSLRVNFITWNDEYSSCWVHGFTSNNTAGDGTVNGIGLDNAAALGNYTEIVANANSGGLGVPLFADSVGSFSEGVHFCTPTYEAVSGGTVTENAWTTFQIRG
jgi:hypothetical protein